MAGKLDAPSDGPFTVGIHLGVSELGRELPDQRPGCGSLSVDPSLATDLELRFGAKF